MTGAYTRRAAHAVIAAALANGHALLALIQNVSAPALADARRHAFTVPASVRADRFALAVDLVVAQIAHARFRQVAVRVLLTAVRADGHADAVLGMPSRLAAAYVRPRATTADAAAIAVRLALAGRDITLVAIATVQDGDPAIVLLTNGILIVLLVRFKI